MKIVNLTQFRALPAGTVFAKYEPCIFGDLAIKGETWEYDFLYQDIIQVEASDSEELFAKLDDAQNNGTSLKLDMDCLSRDGLFDKDQLFAVYEKEDVEQLIARLQTALKDSA